MRRIGLYVFCTLMVGLSAAARGQAPGDAAVADELAALRQELAATRLALRETRAEIEDIKAFLAEKDMEATLADWKKQRDALAEERRLIRLERQRLEKARRELHQATYQDAQEQADQQKAAADAAAKQLEPDWDADYILGLIDREAQTLYVRSTDGRLLLEQYPTVDRRNVMVRGTFLNQSHAPWRYTFEIRVASDSLPGLPKPPTTVIGSWRYQTPLLSPGQLHPFEVKIPVTDVRYVDLIQIGNVTADRPPPQEVTVEPDRPAPPLPPAPLPTE